MLKFTILASGSTGNSIYIGNQNTNILIDCGISGFKVKEALSDIKIKPENIDAIFITHEHLDHIQGAGVLSRKYNIPIYATEKTWELLESTNKIGKILPTNKVVIYINEKIIINDMYLTAFPVPHDAVDTISYNVYYKDKKLSILSDLGHVNDVILEKLKDCSALVIESNYNKQMLLDGAYPQYLKQRVLGNYGHISNETCAKVICTVMSESLKNVVLYHISKENNTKALAMSTVTSILKEYGIIVERDLALEVSGEYRGNKVIEIK